MCASVVGNIYQPIVSSSAGIMYASNNLLLHEADE